MQTPKLKTGLVSAHSTNLLDTRQLAAELTQPTGGKIVTAADLYRGFPCPSCDSPTLAFQSWSRCTSCQREYRLTDSDEPPTWLGELD